MAYNFKDEDEVKEYIKNIGIEYRFSCFHEKRPDGCHLLGDYLESITKDFKKAAKLYQTNCDNYKFSRSCYKYGNYSFIGRGCEENWNTALEYYEKGCELDSPSSCLNAGTMLTTGNRHKVEKKDFALGMKYLNKGCNGGNALSCFFASGVYVSGVENIPKDMTKAFEYSVKGCELGNIYSCMNLNQMYRKGEGVEKNEKMADFYKEKVKDMQDQRKKQGIKFELGS